MCLDLGEHCFDIIVDSDHYFDISTQRVDVSEHCFDVSEHLFGVNEQRFVDLNVICFDFSHSFSRRLAGEKKSASYNHKTTIWVSHEYYLNPEFQKIPARAF